MEDFLTSRSIQLGPKSFYELFDEGEVVYRVENTSFEYRCFNLENFEPEAFDPNNITEAMAFTMGYL